MMKLTDIATINSISIGDTIVTGGMSNYFQKYSHWKSFQFFYFAFQALL